jgi:Fe-S cluster assembly iron-binding protein IscA
MLEVCAQDVNSKIKAIFIYNFTKYIEWPENQKQGDFVIGVLGNSNPNLIKELDKMATLSKIGSRGFVVKIYNSVEEITKCQLQFITAEKSNLITAAVQKVAKNNTLVIGENTGQIKKGAVINFVYQENKQKFELSKTNAERSGLTVSSSLINMAILDEK